MKGGEKMNEYLTPKEVADVLKLRVLTIYEWIRIGKIKALKLGRKTIRINKEELDRLLNERGYFRK